MRSFVRCPSCRQKLLLANNDEGQRKRCPRCATRFAVGSPMHVVKGLIEHLGFELFDQDPVDEIEVLDDDPGDDVIEVLDDPPPVAVVPLPAPEPPAPKKRRPRDDFDENYADEFSGDYLNPADEPWANSSNDYQYDPRDQNKWNLAQWGVTLVLIPLLLFLASFGLSFSSLFVGMGSGIEFGWVLLTAGILSLACDGLRLAGYLLGLYTPGPAMNRIWVLIAIVMSFGAGTILIVPLVLAESIGEPAVVLGVYGLGICVGMCGWGAYLMYLEGLAEMFNERGIADSVAALIKLGATYMLCVLLLYVAVVVMVAIRTGTQGIANADPTDLVAVVCWGILCAFTAILGLVVFIKYILVLLNIRAMIDWCT